MKRLIIVFIMCVFLTGTDVFADTAKWYEGGTLHKATVKKWRNSSYKNRLATAADWFSAITKTHNPELKKKLDNLNNDQWLLAVKAFDQQLEKCVSDTVAETILFKPDDQVAKIAALCYKSMLRSQEPEDKNKPSLYADPTERDGWERAVEIVKNLPCSEGGTIGQYLNKKAAIPAVEDLNWNVSARDYGFEVERKLLIDQRMKAIYRWRVDSAGNTKPLNGKAMGITPGYFSTKPKDKSLPGYQETFEEWQPYKDYLKLDDGYKSPAYEKSLKDSYEAEKIVRNLPCSKGGTLDQYFSKNRQPQLEDLGWNEYPAENGVEVVREFLGQTKLLKYRWHVDSRGKVTPLNDIAIKITQFNPSQSQYKSNEGTSYKKNKVELKPKEYKSGILANYKGYKLEESNHFNEIVKVHSDFIEIVTSQSYKDYINNLPSQEYKAASKIIEAGTTEDVIGLMSRYKKQREYQDSHTLMLMTMIGNYNGANRKKRAMNTIQEWINTYEDISDNPNIIKLKIRKTDASSLEETYLVSYTIARESGQQKYVYEVNTFQRSVRASAVD